MVKVTLCQKSCFTSLCQPKAGFLLPARKELMVEDLYAGSWNTEQGMPHREPLMSYLEDSVMKVLTKQPQEWILVTIGSASQVAKDLIHFEYELKKKKEWQ
jgi:hypothetical protein